MNNGLYYINERVIGSDVQVLAYIVYVKRQTASEFSWSPSVAVEGSWPVSSDSRLQLSGRPRSRRSLGIEGGQPKVILTLLDFIVKPKIKRARSISAPVKNEAGKPSSLANFASQHV